MERTDEPKPFCRLSSAKRSLFDDTNAISIPEKKAEMINIISIKVIVLNSKIQKFKNSKIPRFKNSKIQKFQDSKILLQK